MTNVVELPTYTPMSAAEFKVARERLGLTASWVASQLGVADRSIARYESGEMPVSLAAEELIEVVHAHTNRMVMSSMSKLKLRKGQDFVTLYTFRRDEDMAATYAGNPDTEFGPLTASWHRAMIGRLALITDLPVKIEYITP